MNPLWIRHCIHCVRSTTPVNHIRTYICDFLMNSLVKGVQPCGKNKIRNLCNSKPVQFCPGFNCTGFILNTFLKISSKQAFKEVCRKYLDSTCSCLKFNLIHETAYILM